MSTGSLRAQQEWNASWVSKNQLVPLLTVRTSLQGHYKFQSSYLIHFSLWLLLNHHLTEHFSMELWACSADISILLSNQYVDNYVPQQQLNGCSTLPLCKGCGLWDYPRISSWVSWFFLLLVQITKMLSINLWEASVSVWVLCEMSKYEQQISCSHLLSSLSVHCSYRLKFFVVRDHLWDGNSPPQLQFSWSRLSKV